jgi:DNA-binding LytR/AlgR family response regulator
MKVLIIEDEAPAFRRLEKLLEQVDPKIEILEVFDTVEDSVEWIQNPDAKPDLIFMDIQLSDGISFEIFEKTKVQYPVIFTTAFDEYMLKAFKVNSIDYLLKPIKKEDLAQGLSKFRSLRNAFNHTAAEVDLNEVIQSIRLDDKKYKSRFLVKLGDKLISVETSDIAYFYLHHAVVHLVTRSGKNYLMDYNLDELAQQLDPEIFYRINRQYLAHFSAITTVHKYHKGKLLVDLNPERDEQVVVSAEKAADFKSWLGDK